MEKKQSAQSSKEKYSDLFVNYESDFTSDTLKQSIPKVRSVGEIPTPLITEELKVHKSHRHTGATSSALSLHAFASSSDNLSLQISALSSGDVCPKSALIRVPQESITVVKEKRETRQGKPKKKSRSSSRGQDGRKPLSKLRSASVEAQDVAPSGSSCQLPVAITGDSFAYDPAPLIINTNLVGAARYPVEQYSPPVRDRADTASLLPAPHVKDIPAPIVGRHSLTQPIGGAFSLASYIQPLNLSSLDLSVTRDANFESAVAMEDVDSGLEDATEEERLRLRTIRLEGKLSVVGQEAESSLRQRAELTAEVATLKTQLKIVQTQLHENDIVDRLRSELKTMHESREHIETDLASTQAALDTKVAEAKSLMNELQMSRKTGDTLHNKSRDLEDLIDSKDTIVQSLKSKVVELYSQVEMMRINKEKMEQDSKALHAEIVSLQKSREWYQEQLNATQEARTKLQVEMNKLQSWMTEGANLNDGLNHDNNILKLRISKMEQSVIEEKRSLARELEVIRGDMIEREAVFEQILQERNALEEAFNCKMKLLSDERLRLDAVRGEMAELEQEVSELTQRLTQGKEALDAAEREKIELIKRATFAEECINQKQAIIDDQCSKYNEVADKLRKLEDTCRDKEELLQILSDEKSALEVTLMASRKEKEAMDKYLINLKADLGKVEDSFQQMRQELGSKTCELNQVASLRNDMSNDIEMLQNVLGEKNAFIAALSKEKEKAEQSFQVLQHENNGLHEDIRSLRENLESAEMKLAQVEQQLETVSNEKTHVIQELTIAQAEVGSLKKSMRDMRSEVELLSEEHKKYMLLLTAHETMTQQFEKLVQEHNRLSEQYTMETEELKLKIKETENYYQKQVHDKVAELEMLMTELEATHALKSQLEAEMVALKEQHTLEISERNVAIETKMLESAQQLSCVHESKTRVESRLDELQRDISTLTQEYNEKLMTCQSELIRLEERSALCDRHEVRNRDLAAELERVRGEAAGLVDTLNQLKRHVSVLEVALAKRESSFAELVDKSQERIVQLTDERMEAASNLERLAASHRDIDLSRLHLEEQLATSASHNLAMRLELERLRAERDRVVAELDARGREVAGLTAELTAVREEGAQRRSALDREMRERELGEVARRGLVDDLAESARRQMELEGLLETARINLAAKLDDLTQLQTRLEGVVLNHVLEMDGMKDLLRNSEETNASLKAELAATRDEKLSYQTKLAHLRGALRAALQRHRLFSTGQGEGEGGEATSNIGIDLRQLEKLLEDTTPLIESKPLRGLNRCLDNLQSEMGSLQDRMTEHTVAVHASVNSWRRIEAQASELKRVCSEGRISPSENTKP